MSILKMQQGGYVPAADNTARKPVNRYTKRYTGDREDLILKKDKDNKNVTIGAVTGKQYGESTPQSGAIELDNDTMMAVTGVGGAIRGGQALIPAILDEVTMGGRSILKGVGKKLNGYKVTVNGHSPFDLQKISNANKKAFAYHSKVNSPANIQKMRELDKANGNNDLITSLQSWNKKFKDNPENPLNISMENFDDNLLNGQAGVTQVGEQNRAAEALRLNKSYDEVNKAKALNQPYGDRYVTLSKKLSKQKYYDVIAHEGKHDRTGGYALIGDTQKNDIQRAFKSESEFVNGKLNNNPSLSNNELNILAEEHEYLTIPTEVDAHLGTNLKDELVNTEVLKNVTDDVTPQMLNYAMVDSPTMSRYAGLIKDRNAFADMINRLTYTGTGIGTGYSKLKSNNK